MNYIEGLEEREDSSITSSSVCSMAVTDPASDKGLEGVCSTGVCGHSGIVGADGYPQLVQTGKIGILSSTVSSLSLSSPKATGYGEAFRALVNRGSEGGTGTVSVVLLANVTDGAYCGV